MPDAPAPTSPPHVAQNAAAAPMARPRILLPKTPVVVQDGASFCVLTLDGAFERMTADQLRGLLRQHSPLVCHGASIAKRLGMERIPCYDALELFAFIHPARFCVPTPPGLARALNLLEPENAEDAATALRDIARHLLLDLQAQDDAAPPAQRKDIAALAAMMGLMGAFQTNAAPDLIAEQTPKAQGWPWAPVVLAALGRTETPPAWGEIRSALRIWDRLPEWAQHAPEGEAAHLPVTPEEAAERLHRLLARQRKEDRPQQRSYATAITDAFAPRAHEGQTHVVLAEAGTGTGKTLGYLAPASVWAEKNGGAVWISTYTRNLQKQVESELERLYDDPVTRARKVVTRKGRENYLCLLNLEDAGASQSVMGSDVNATSLGLMLRWAGATSDGDMTGRDFPGWLPGLMGWHRIWNYSDRRGECIYAACPHFDKCFVEKSIRKSKRADIVIANHALVMHQAVRAGAEDDLPTRFVFDEGHHIFEAADGAFGSQITGSTTADLRRWILGSEAGKSRARGLKRRVEELIAGDDAGLRALEDILHAARILPGPQWRQRLGENAPVGVSEIFVASCVRQVSARNKENEKFYSLETPLQPALPELTQAALAFAGKLGELLNPMRDLAARLNRILTDDDGALDTNARERLRTTANSLTRRAEYIVTPWIAMLKSIQDGTPDTCCDWLEISRIDGRDEDAGLYRAYIDPSSVFAAQMKHHTHGMVVTSASLRDPAPEDAQGWKSPLQQTGANALTAGQQPPRTFDVPSPFNYAEQTRIIVIKDVEKGNIDEVAAAYRTLFMAAGGGALGLFTAVQRLKNVQHKLAPAMEKAGIHLYAQHVDALDTGTLIDIFRAEENACLLGTDATRDGIDVPGRSLRLVVYDRVPWPRPTILHKARREHFGKAYDDMLTRFKIKQAYGRLIRKSDDKGVFVMLDSALPTRLTTAFPPNVDILRIGLKDAAQLIAQFLAEKENA